jgi:hypothetical protein
VFPFNLFSEGNNDDICMYTEIFGVIVYMFVGTQSADGTNSVCTVTLYNEVPPQCILTKQVKQKYSIYHTWCVPIVQNIF